MLNPGLNIAQEMLLKLSNSLGFVEEVNREGTNITLTHKQPSKDAIEQKIHACTIQKKYKTVLMIIHKFSFVNLI